MPDWEELRRRLREDRPVPWEQMPDFALYMDQVLNYMDRQVIRFEEEDRLTSAMINNYTKNGLVPRAGGKKYGREHLAYLTAICILKRVMSTRDMDLLIRQELRGRHSVKEGYDAFCASLDKALMITARELERRHTETLPPEQPQEHYQNPSRTADENQNQAQLMERDHQNQNPEQSNERNGGGQNERKTYSLADNAIHFALLSYAAGIASNRYVAMLRRETEQRQARHYHNNKISDSGNEKPERTKKIK